MSNNTTIDEIHSAIDPMPAELNAKGKVKPEVSLDIRANAGVGISMNWEKFGAYNREYEFFSGNDFEQALAKATDFIKSLPSAQQANLHDFMRQLGHLIDAGQSAGIEIEHLNPLIASMKSLSENVLTYRPKRSAS